MDIYSELFVFVEGSDDERFINSIALPIWEKKYNNVKIIRYACKPVSDITSIISVLKKRKSCDYIFICDMDAKGDTLMCITSRKNKKKEKFKNILDIDKILVVKEEIESWYLSILIGHKTNNYRIKDYDKLKNYGSTENVTKEEFRKLIPKRFDSISDFMIEILKEVSLDRDAITNNSLNYFFRKYL